jgi:hypothetical protein
MIFWLDENKFYFPVQSSFKIQIDRHDLNDFADGPTKSFCRKVLDPDLLKLNPIFVSYTEWIWVDLSGSEWIWVPMDYFLLEMCDWDSSDITR